jgi:hypothetical protein
MYSRRIDCIQFQEFLQTFFYSLMRKVANIIIFIFPQHNFSRVNIINRKLQPVIIEGYRKLPYLS